MIVYIKQAAYEQKREKERKRARDAKESLNGALVIRLWRLAAYALRMLIAFTIFLWHMRLACMCIYICVSVMLIALLKCQLFQPNHRARSVSFSFSLSLCRSEKNYINDGIFLCITHYVSRLCRFYELLAQIISDILSYRTCAFPFVLNYFRF